MRTLLDPPMHRWQLRKAGGSQHEHRRQLQAVVDDNARRLGTGAMSTIDAIIATGHQAWLWHPGILAKDLAMMAAADTHRAGALHVVVDQDTASAGQLDVPMQQGDRLLTGGLEVLESLPDPDVPTGLLPPLMKQSIGQPAVTARSAGARASALRAVRSQRADPKQDEPPLRPAVGFDRLRDAMIDLPDCATLAEQVTAVLARLWRQTAGAVPVVFVTQLAKLDAMQELVQALRDDAWRCLLAYNAAVAKHPQAGVPPLTWSRGPGLNVVELPLWVVIAQSREHEGQSRRRRVYVDFDTQRLLSAGGREIDGQRDLLLPRALTLTALMRSTYCDLFIHGTGGGVYDRITDAWWQTWQGEALAPPAVVTADLYLPLDASTADRNDLAQAVWYAHHLPHNIERYVDQAKLSRDEAELVAQKKQLLAQLHPPGKQRRYSHKAKAQRAAWFEQLHTINGRLAAGHATLVDAAREDARRAARGVMNAAVLRRRDWCFALYGEQQLAALSGAIAAQAHSTCTPEAG